MSDESNTRVSVRAEFDLLADEYHEQHKANIAVTGEGPEYFSEYKIADLDRFLAERQVPVRDMLDFGSGIGNSLPFFRRYFPGAALSCADVSERSIQIARKRFPGTEKYVLIDDTIPVPDSSQDVVFSACVFHHIPHEEHQHWLKELLRVTRPGGVLAIYEHNPFNPLTVRAVNTCPLDVNAKLIRGREMGAQAVASGWTDAAVRYKLFFPALLKPMRALEKYLQWVPLGAQYRMTAQRQE